MGGKSRKKSTVSSKLIQRIKSGKDGPKCSSGSCKKKPTGRGFVKK